MSKRVRLEIALFAALLAGGGFLSLTWRPDAAVSDECRNAPKVVPFHQGMTLCPGQSATTIIILPPLPDLPEPPANDTNDREI